MDGCGDGEGVGVDSATGAGPPHETNSKANRTSAGRLKPNAFTYR